MPKASFGRVFPVLLPVVQEVWLQLEDVSLQRWHMTGLGFQVLHLTQPAEQHLPGLLHFPPHAQLLPFQCLVTALQSSNSFFRAPKFLLQSLITQHGLLYLSVSGTPQQLYLVDNVLQALLVAVGAAFQVVVAHTFLGSLFLVGYKTAFLWFMFGMAFPQSYLNRSTTGDWK